MRVFDPAIFIAPTELGAIMSYQNNVLSFEGIRASGYRAELKDEHQGSVDVCRRTMVRLVPKLLSEMFESLDDALYDLADKSESNIRQNEFFDSMREIRKNRERIEVGFGQNVMKEFDEFWKSGVLLSKSEANGSESEFSLIGEDDLEEGLAITNMTSRGENRHYDALYGLSQRFGHMLGGVELSIKGNPLSPGAICQSFYRLFKVVQVDIAVKLVVYKQFQIHVIDEFGAVYDELNQHLVRAGVLPKIAKKIKRSVDGQPPDESGSVSPGENPPGVSGDAQDEEARLQAEFFSTLKQLLNRKRRLTIADYPLSAALPVIDSSEVIQALSELQHGENSGSKLTTDGVPGGTDVRTNLVQVMGLAQGASANKKFNGNDEDTIDVISMLFDFILEDRNLPDAMKALLSRLQIPMLKVAILDKAFFHSKGHPARRLLNVMASAAIGWSEQAGKADGGLYDKLKSIVERVLHNFDKDVSIFAHLLEELNAFLQREEQGSKMAEQRVAQVTQGKEQLNNARRRVFEEINNRIFGKDWIPAPVTMLIKDGWRDVLLLVSLRQGEESEEWKGALALMDKLLWSVEPNPDKSRRQQLLNEIPLLLKGLRAGLKEISYDQHKMARMFKELQVCHIKCLKGDAAGDVTTQADGGDSTDSSFDASAQLQPEPADPTQGSTSLDPMLNDEYQEQAEKFRIGTWFEIQEANGMKFRAKLSWRSTVSGTCLFVNRKGMKVVEIPVTGFASWLRTGKAVALEDVGVPLMDRALDAMIDVLKKTEA